MYYCIPCPPYIKSMIQLPRFRVVGVAGIWILMSAGLVMLNKIILTRTDFKFVISLALSHMVCASGMSRMIFACFPLCENQRLYAVIDPLGLAARFGAIGCLFAVSLVCSNAALSRLDVSLVQMMKALNPVIIYVTSICLGLDKLDKYVATSIAFIASGVLVAVHGSMRFDSLGMIMQLISIISDALRITVVQSTLQSSEYSIDSLNLIHMIAPATSMFLWFAASIIELPHMDFTHVMKHAVLIGVSAISAFALNLASYAFIKWSSALTLSVTGIIKDILLVSVASTFFDDRITSSQCVGYFIALLGIFAYNLSLSNVK